MENEPRKAYIVVVEDKEITSREYVTLARSQEEAANNIINGHYITESDSVVIEHLEATIIRADLLDEEFAVKVDAAIARDEAAGPQELLDEANKLMNEAERTESL